MLCHFEAHYYWSYLSAGCALVGLPAVKHGQAPSALVVLSLSAASAPSALCEKGVWQYARRHELYDNRSVLPCRLKGVTPKAKAEGT